MTGPYGPTRGRSPQRTPGAPRQGAPRQAAPRQAAPRQAAPRQAAPRQAAPRQPAPRRAAAAPRQADRYALRQPPRRPARPARPPRRRTPRRLKLGGLNGRLRYGFVAVCVLLLVIGGRLVLLQGVDGQKYAAAAASQRIVEIPVHALRGQILDRNGAVLAYTSEAQDITADPQQVTSAANKVAVAKHRAVVDVVAEYARKLSAVIGTSVPDLIKAMTGDGRYALLATALSPQVAQRVSDLNLPGIYTQATTKRQYPGTTTGANVIGTVHGDGTGAAGIESEFEKVLAGSDGSLTYTVDNLGNLNPSSRTVDNPARNGGAVRLTLDQALQYTAQHYVDQAVQESGARRADLVVLDAHTAQVLAMASSDTYNSADPNTIDPNSPSNPPVMSAFEPGSVQKAITFAAALQEKKITPRTVLTVPDQIQMGGVTVGDAWYHPTEHFYATGVLAQSSNVGTLQIAKELGPTTWMKYEQLFGVGQKTGVELPGESSGYLPPMKDWSASTFANLPFGQGESMTVLQLASIYQAIANDGVRIPPRIVSSITSASGATTPNKQPQGIKVVDPKTAETLRTMLESVTMKGGTGTKAAIAGYRVAGKTGTAQQPDPAHGGAYSDWMYWDTFAGMVPADDPQFVVAIMVDNPAHGLEGGDVAAPLFHEVASYELMHAQIPPTGSTSKYVPLLVCDAVARLASPTCAG